jgi:carbon-monoxide dehydrogenase small subunit
MTERSAISLSVNSHVFNVRIEPRKSLADTLREDCGLTGTHLGCEHGVCGACTVLFDGRPVRSCLMFGVQAQGHEVRTVESLNQGEELNPLQQAFCDNHALQCGYCTPGFLMLVTGALEKNPDISDEEIVEVLSSNLCRCTGYANIIKAVQQVRDRTRLAAPT